MIIVVYFVTLFYSKLQDHTFNDNVPTSKVRTVTMLVLLMP